jgi:hypothetical protein
MSIVGRHAIRLEAPVVLEVALAGDAAESRRASAVAHAESMAAAARAVANAPAWTPRPEPGELVGRVIANNRVWLIAGSMGVTDVGFGPGSRLRVVLRWAWLEAGDTADQSPVAGAAAVRAFTARVREHLSEGWAIPQL